MVAEPGEPGRKTRETPHHPEHGRHAGERVLRDVGRRSGHLGRLHTQGATAMGKDSLLEATPSRTRTGIPPEPDWESMGRDLRAFAREAEQEERHEVLASLSARSTMSNPVPDAGARLEDLLIRLRRPLGMTMSQWSNEVQEAYRKVQRALVRARKMEPKKDLTKAILDKSTSSKSEPHGEPQGGAGSQGVRTPSVISALGTATRTAQEGAGGGRGSRARSS